MKKLFNAILFFGMMLCMTLLVDVKAYANPGDPLCFTAIEDNCSIQLKKVGTPNEVSIECSTDGSTWKDYEIGSTIYLQSEGEYVYFRNKSEDIVLFSTDYKNYYNFAMTGKINASGDITTLLKKNGTNELHDNQCFAYLFYNCHGLYTAPELPATTLSYGCYAYMFSTCTSLVKAPELPATTLTEVCYYNMFYHCLSLKDAPKLPATTLTYRCYSRMFYDCTSLVDAPKLPATNLADECYWGMFYYCSALKDAPALPATELKNGCYMEMFAHCTSLVNAPELPATTLARSCYATMFAGCTSLEKAPKLPAGTLVHACYLHMFDGCSSLNFVWVNFKKWLNTDERATYIWLEDVSAKGIFVSPINLSRETGTNGIPSGWIQSKEITVTFDPNGYEKDTFTKNHFSYMLIEKPETLTSGDYICEKWFKEAECINRWDFEKDTPKDNITLYGKWSNSYIVTFDVCGHGTAPSDQSFEYKIPNQHVVEPADPTCEGYNFDGWYKEKEYINKWNFDTDIVDNDITLYAKWLGSNKVTFDICGHGTAVQPQYFSPTIPNEHVVKPETPTCEGYIFNGWYKEVGYLNRWDFDNDIVTSSMTLYAKWNFINTSSGIIVTSYFEDPITFMIYDNIYTSSNKVSSFNELLAFNGKCYYYDGIEKLLYIKFGEELQITTSSGGSHTKVVYKDKEVIKEVIKEVEKIVNPNSITGYDDNGNKVIGTLNSDGTYSFKVVNETPIISPDLDKKDLLKDLPSKGIKLVIGLDECGIDGELKKQDAPPEVIDGVTFLPIRLIAEYLGAKVSWDAESPNRVEISKKDKTIVLTIGSKVALVNGKEYTLDYAPYIKYDRTYLPVRFIVEHLGALVEWNENSPYEIIIK